MKQERWSLDRYREFKNRTAKNKNKYNARKTEGGGRVFDSKKEARHAGYLKILQRCGEIAAAIPQVSIPVGSDSNRRYVADFLVLKPGWENYVEFIDVKGADTPLSKLKRDLLREHYGIDVILV